MASQAELINIAMTNLSAKITEITADPKPTYSIDGQTVKHSQYLETLITSLDMLIPIRRKLQGPFQRITKSGSL